ncbi:Px [Velvet tobacco mottle virus]|uniref:Px n=1 Tax=Velvet tobacco mottle virus TaxID=12473 RepID=UPI0003D40681|nr:Px [Velvet tobacco mottle virus]
MASLDRPVLPRLTRTRFRLFSYKSFNCFVIEKDVERVSPVVSFSNHDSSAGSVNDAGPELRVADHHVCDVSLLRADNQAVQALSRLHENCGPR